MDAAKNRDIDHGGSRARRARREKLFWRRIENSHHLLKLTSVANKFLEKPLIKPPCAPHIPEDCGDFLLQTGLVAQIEERCIDRHYPRESASRDQAAAG